MEINQQIDGYFNGNLNKQEQDDFLQLLESDEAFAAEVSLYLASRNELREILLENKRQQWKALVVTESPIHALPAKAPKKLGWWHYAAAACLLLAAFFVYQNNQTGPKQLADKYVETELGQLSQTMGSETDSLSMGIAAYNQKDYVLAGRIFGNLAQKSNAIYPDALKNAGFVSLATKNYDQAIEQFAELANIKELYANPGCFYQAIALLLRNNKTDKENAKILFEKVVNEQLEGAEIAESWLKKY